MFKLSWKYEPQAIEWFYGKVLNVSTSFLWTIRIQTIENCCRFAMVFTLIDHSSRPISAREIAQLL